MNPVDKPLDKPDSEYTNPMTSVKVQFTEVKFYNATSNTVEAVDLIGKIPVAHCKKYVRALNEKNIYIGKTTTNIGFKVSSIELYALKQED